SSLHETTSVKTPAENAPVKSPSPDATTVTVLSPSSTQRAAAEGADEPTRTDSAPTKRSARPNDPMIVFAYDCLRRELKDLVRRQPAERTALTTDDVHRMRIAMRRLRVALRLFRRMLPRAAQDFRKDLRSFARALGDVRDVDVHAETFRTFAQTIPADA